MTTRRLLFMNIKTLTLWMAIGLPVLAAVAAEKPKMSPPAIKVAPMNTIYQYTADTVSPTLVKGAVVATGVNWSCAASRCTAAGPWPVPAVGSCKALAQKVGVIKAYGHPTKQLNAAELQQCNVGAATGPIGGGLAVLNKTSPSVPGSSGSSSSSSSGAIRPGGAITPITPGGRVINPNILRAVNLRGQHFANLQRIREQAEAAARRQREQEEERRRLANTSRGTDCDDTRRDVHPLAAEVCDGRDNNCDGYVDEGQTVPRYLDADGDGHGNPARRMDVCPYDITAAARSAETLGTGWLVEIGNDCDDSDPARWNGCL
jgi:hypothetical protein